MSDTKALNNQIDVLNGRLDYVESKRAEAVRETEDMRKQRDAARSQATYFRTECRTLAARGNAVHTIQTNLASRLDAHKRDLIPGDRIHAAAIVELQTVLDVINTIIEKGQADA